MDGGHLTYSVRQRKVFSFWSSFDWKKPEKPVVFFMKKTNIKLWKKTGFEDICFFSASSINFREDDDLSCAIDSCCQWMTFNETAIFIEFRSSLSMDFTTWWNQRGKFCHQEGLKQPSSWFPIWGQYSKQMNLHLNKIF